MPDHPNSLLLSGERVLWQGEPAHGLILRPIDLFLIPFSLMWGGFAVFWNDAVWFASTKGTDLFFKLWGLPFLFAGFYITIGRFLIDMRSRKALLYLITNQRIVIAKHGGGSTKSLDIKHLPAIELIERPDGSGTIRFGTGPSLFAGNNFGIWQPSLDATPQFIRIANVRRIYDLIQMQAKR